MNLENAQAFLPSSETEAFDVEAAQRIIQNILFVKHPSENRFDPLIVRYYPDEETSTRDFDEINYQMIDEKWSGTVDLFTYDEHYFMGFEIHKGQILATRQMETLPDHNRKSLGLENKDVRCAITTTDWYQISYVKATNTWVVQQLSPTHSYSCGMGSYDSGGPPSAGTYSYGGGFFVTSGGTAGYGPPDVPMPKLTIYIDSSFSKNQTLKCAQEMLALSKFVNSLTEFTNKTSPKNVTLRIGATKNPDASAETDGTTYGHNNIVITFNEKKVNNMSSLGVARVLLHEIIHAEIYNAVGEKRGSLLVGNFQNNFEEYKKLYPNNNSLQQHNFMADYIVEKIAKTLQEIHPLLGASEFYQKVGGTTRWQKGINPTFYTAIAWHGLNSTKEWNEMKYNDRKVLQDLQDLDRELTKTCIQ
ncbi:hypothetical protein GCM10027164_04350 [Algoriphagus taiwanensis]